MKHLKTYQDITTIEGLAKINPAFDKMAVLAENLDKLEDIYNFLFKYKEYVKILLDAYVSTNGVVTSGDTAFDITKLKDLEANKIKIPGTEYYGLISLGFIDNDKSTTGIKLGLYTKDDLLLGEIKYGYDPVEEKFYTLIPATHGEIQESIVNVEYLNLTKEEILAKFNEFKTEITNQFNETKNDINNKHTALVASFDDYKNVTNSSIAEKVALLQKQIDELKDKNTEDSESSFVAIRLPEDGLYKVNFPRPQDLVALPSRFNGYEGIRVTAEYHYDQNKGEFYKSCTWDSETNCIKGLEKITSPIEDEDLYYKEKAIIYIDVIITQAGHGSQSGWVPTGSPTYTYADKPTKVKKVIFTRKSKDPNYGLITEF